MKLEFTLLAVTLALFMISAATAFAVEEQQAGAIKAEKPDAKKPLKKDSRIEEKTAAPKVMLLRDWEELFGHKPMDKETDMPMPEPTSGASQQETIKPMQKHDHMQEKH